MREDGVGGRRRMEDNKLQTTKTRIGNGRLV